MSRILLRRGLLLSAVVAVGCGNADYRPVYTPAEAQEMLKQELSGEMKRLEEIEKKFGKNHPEVKQRRLELGLDKPENPVPDDKVSGS
jgi:hypothetical protein